MKPENWKDLNGYSIGRDTTVVNDCSDGEINYGFNGFFAEYYYRIRIRDGLYETLLSANGGLDPICITDDFHTAFYASYFHSARQTLYAQYAENGRARPYLFRAGDEPSFYTVLQNGRFKVGFAVDNEYIEMYTFPTLEEATGIWNRLTYELEELNKLFDTLTEENRIGPERKSELLRTAFLNFSDITLPKKEKSGRYLGQKVGVAKPELLGVKEYDRSQKHYLYRSYMLSAVYKGAVYDMEFRNGEMVLHSENALNENSAFREDHYLTPVSIDELTDILEDVLFVRYRDEIYPVWGVYGAFDSLVIFKADGRLTEEDVKLGFRYDEVIDEYCLKIQGTEEHSLYTQRYSIYQFKKDMIEGSTAKKRK